MGEGTVRLFYRVAHGAATSGSRFSAQLAEPDEGLGWSLIPGASARHRSAEFDVEVSINPHGYRQLDPPPPERSPGARRIAVIGDSFAFGYGVAEEARFDRALARAWPEIETVNQAVPGTGTDQQVLRYEEHGSAWRPDVLLLLYFFESVVRNGTDRYQGKPKPRFVRRDGRLERAPEWVVASESAAPRARGLPIPFKAWLGAHSELYRLLRAALSPRGDAGRSAEEDLYPEYAAGAPAWEVTRALLERLRDRAAADGGRLVVALVPEPWHLAAGAGDQHARIVDRACRELEIPALDLIPVLRRDPDAYYFPLDGHWTPAGHEVVADALAAFLPAYLPD